MGMYVRTIKRKNKDGSVVEYIQLAHNTRHPEKGYSRAEVIYSFGRRDQLDIEAIKRLVRSLCRFVSPEDALALQSKSAGNHGLKFVRSRSAGGALVLKALWDRINIKQCLDKILEDRSFTAPMEQALFAMVANRALAPASKLAVEQWANKDVYLGGNDQIQVQHLYRGMDLLLEHQDTIQKEVFWSTANLLNLTVDLIFFDTTNTYFEIEEPGPSDIKAYGKSKDKRDDLPLVTIGLAVTREGIPVRCWVMPGNQHDAKCVDQVQKDLNNWKLGRVVWAMDRGMASEENRRILQRAGGQYILGEKLSGTKANEEALNRGGRFKVLNDNLHIKEVFVGEGTGRRRFIIAYNPQQAKHDRHTREKVLKRIGAELAAIDKLAKDKQAKAKYHLLTHKSMGRYLKEQKNGKLRIDKSKVKQDQKLDGKYLLSTSDESLSAEDVALGYKQLMKVERAFRTLKGTLSLRPVYHTKDDRIRSHVLLCWLALLLVRIAENESGLTWYRLRAEMERLSIGEFVNKDGRILQYTELTPNQRNIFKTLKIKPPKNLKKVDLIP
jgi:transposase